MFKNAEKIDPFDNFDWNSGRSHKGRIMKIFAGNGYSRQGRLNGKIEIEFSSGEELSGVFYQGKRHGKCTIKSPEKGIRYREDYLLKNQSDLMAQLPYLHPNHHSFLVAEENLLLKKNIIV